MHCFTSTKYLTKIINWSFWPFWSNVVEDWDALENREREREREQDNTHVRTSIPRTSMAFAVEPLASSWQWVTANLARVGGRAVARECSRFPKKRFSLFAVLRRIIGERRNDREGRGTSFLSHRSVVTGASGGSMVGHRLAEISRHVSTRPSVWQPRFALSLYLVTFEQHQTNVTGNLLAKLVTKRSTYLPISHFLFLHVK